MADAGPKVANWWIHSLPDVDVQMPPLAEDSVMPEIAIEEFAYG